MAHDTGEGVDTLSRLLSLFTLRTSLDIRCALAAPWVREEPASTAGVAPYHLIVEGEALDDTPTGERIVLRAGDIVVFPQGGAHRLHAGPQEQALPLVDVPGPAPLRWVSNGGDGTPTGILCGQFVFDDGARRVLQPALPAMIVVHASSRPDFSGLLALVTMLRSEADSARPGAAAVVAQLSGGRVPGWWKNWRRPASCRAPPSRACSANWQARRRRAHWCNCA